MKYLIILFLLSSLPIHSQIIKAKIVNVLEADVLVFQDKDNNEQIIKLDGIDTPREGHPYWDMSTDFTQRKCEGKEALVKVTYVDSIDQIYGILYVNGKNINEALLIEGLAWLNEYNNSQYWINLEEKARNVQLNIWTLEYPMGRESYVPIYRTGKIKPGVYMCSQNPALYHIHKECRILNSCSSDILKKEAFFTESMLPCSLCSTRRYTPSMSND